MLVPGQKLFEYDIIRPLGQGGFAAVFEAYDRVLDRRVAIKELLLKRAKDERSVKRFLQEARVAAALEHPNVVSIYAMRPREQEFYLVMEYLAGGNLRELVDRHKKLPVEQAVRLAIGIGEGLAKFHEKGIIHRDIKADNILLTADGWPKVIDFGIAHVPEAAGGMDLTQVGFQPSTLIYSSPEQVRGEPVDARSDVYQLGELLYYMLAGRHYIELTALERQAITHAGSNQIRSQAKLYELLEQAICYDMPAGLRTLWREVGALAEVVERALAKEKDQRFEDAGEFAATLKTLSINTIPTSVESREGLLQDSRAYNKRGLAHLSTRNYEQAMVDFTKAIKLDGHYAEAYNNRSTAHLLMANYGQALVDCNKALELAPDFVAAYVNRGIAHTELKYYDLALADFSQAIDLNPEYVYAYYNRATAHRELKNYRQAIEDYTRVVELNPEHQYVYENRGDMYAAIGDGDRASDDYTRIIVQTASINPKRLSVARSMLMPATPLDFLKREE